eukprot:COSAG02_NODE_3694_length_6364_cov_3.261950_3_plen_112_part_00
MAAVAATLSALSDLDKGDQQGLRGMPDFSAEQLTQIFQRLDADGSGRIDVYELQKVVQRHLPDHDEAHAAALRLIEQVSMRSVLLPSRLRSSVAGTASLLLALALTMRPPT